MKRTILTILVGFAVCAPVSATAQMTPMNTCVAKKARYVESASRKLYRALVSKGYTMKNVGIEPSFVVDSAGGDNSQQYVAFPQHEGSVVGVVAQEPKVAKTYVVANTTRGHLIAVINWSGGCHPTSSDVAHPRVKQSRVDMQPFKYWGFRMLWNLPSKFSQGDSTASLSALLKKD